MADETSDRARTGRMNPPPGARDRAPRPTIPPPGDQQIVYRAEVSDGIIGARRPGFDVLATVGGALAALGTFVLISALVGAVVGSIGYQADIKGEDLSIGALVAGLMVLLVSCLIGGFVAGRLVRRRGGLHGLVTALWLVVVAAVLAVLAGAAGSDLDVRDRVGLPDWFSSDAVGTTAVITGVAALVLMLLGGWLGGRLGARHRDGDDVELIGHRTDVRRHDGGIIAEGRR